MSRQEMADAVNQALDNLYPGRNLAGYYVDARWIGKLERGEHRWPGVERRAALRMVSGTAADHELGLHRPRHVERGVSAVILQGVAPPVGADSAGGARRIASLQQSAPADDWVGEVGLSSEGGWNSFSLVTSMLAQQRQAVAPEALLKLIEAHRDCLSTLFQRAARSDPLRAEIGAMLGEASVVASRLWSALGNRDMALAHCAYARSLGDRLENRRLGATARIFESNLYSEAATLIEADGEIMIGLRLLDVAAGAGISLSAPARARIAAEQAQAYAALRLEGQTESALGRARESVGEIAPEDCVGLYSDWNPSRLKVYEGTCHILLDQPSRAVEKLETAIRELSADHLNLNVTLAARVDLAVAYAQLGELETSCGFLGETYELLRVVGNLRGIRRARRARQRLTQWDGEPVVRELDLRMAAA
ncbi:XRE family transcriptional regulator [Krasilnikovia sp. MM14-A1004]|uniref:XRE family transcriptional regulator n=1 Tax=Krasilnikovia sp. MM14-A1004 TaxID=3373541 RepID=UPI00399C7089